MLRFLRLVVIISLFSLIGCANNDDTKTPLEQINNHSPELMKLSTQGVTEQRISNQAKQSISKHPEVSEVRAINVNNDLFIAIDIRQRDRFSLDKIEKKLKKKIDREFPKMTVTLSTDQKFIIEVEKLEKQIDKNELNKDTLQKRVDKLKKLSKEET